MVALFNCIFSNHFFVFQIGFFDKGLYGFVLLVVELLTQFTNFKKLIEFIARVCHFIDMLENDELPVVFHLVEDGSKKSFLIFKVPIDSAFGYACAVRHIRYGRIMKAAARKQFNACGDNIFPSSGASQGSKTCDG